MLPEYWWLMVLALPRVQELLAKEWPRGKKVVEIRGLPFRCYFVSIKDFPCTKDEYWNLVEVHDFDANHWFCFDLKHGEVLLRVGPHLADQVRHMITGENRGDLRPEIPERDGLVCENSSLYIVPAGEQHCPVAFNGSHALFLVAKERISESRPDPKRETVPLFRSSGGCGGII